MKSWNNTCRICWLGSKFWKRGHMIQTDLMKSNRYQAKLARTCYDLGTLYADYGDSHHMDFAKQELLRAKRIYEQLVAENQSTYLIDLAKACYCLGIVYACTNCPELANEEFCRSRDLFEQDSKIHRFIKFRWGRSIRTWSFKYVCSFLHKIRLKQPINVSTLRCIAYSSTFSTISIIKCYTSKRKATYPIWHRKTNS